MELLKCISKRMSCCLQVSLIPVCQIVFRTERFEYIIACVFLETVDLFIYCHYVNGIITFYLITRLSLKHITANYRFMEDVLTIYSTFYEELLLAYFDSANYIK